MGKLGVLSQRFRVQGFTESAHVTGLLYNLPPHRVPADVRRIESKGFAEDSYTPPSKASDYF